MLLDNAARYTVSIDYVMRYHGVIQLWGNEYLLPPWIPRICILYFIWYMYRSTSSTSLLFLPNHICAVYCLIFSFDSCICIIVCFISSCVSCQRHFRRLYVVASPSFTVYRLILWQIESPRYEVDIEIIRTLLLSRDNTTHHHHWQHDMP